MTDTPFLNTISRLARAGTGVLLSICLTCQGSPALAGPSDTEIVVLSKASDMAPEAIGALLFPQSANLAAAPAEAMGESDAKPLAQSGVVHVSRRQFLTRGIHLDGPVEATNGPLAKPSEVAAATASPERAPLAPRPRPSSIAVPVNFAFNSAELDAQARTVLDQIGKTLAMSQYANKRLVIEGHTDSVGSDRYNFELSLRRASSAATYLHDRFGISYDRLTLQGKGGNDPIKGFSLTDAVQRRIQFTAV